MSQPVYRAQGTPYTLPTAVQLVPNGGYAQETTLQKNNAAAAYITNAGSNAAPVIQGAVAFQGGVTLQAGADISGAVTLRGPVTFVSAPVVPAGALVGTVTVTALATGQSLTLLTGFPANASGFYSVSFVCTTPGQQFNVSGVGRLVQVAGVVSAVDGFSGTAVGPDLLGTSPNQTVAFCEITCNTNGSLSFYNGTGVALTGTVNIYKLASSN